MISEKFFDRMRDLLAKDFDDFEAALEKSCVRAIRVNTTKIAPDRFLEITKHSLRPLSYCSDGFIPEVQEGLGAYAEHHCGAYYVQDPGAMATVNALDVPRGAWVLDCCSAPGGKASQLASLIGDEGFILANEYVPKRAKIIVSNFERLGIRNAMVVSMDTAELSRMFRGAFDIVLCDAPCSGEGMLRKYDAASEEWSEENVALCAARQSEILDNVIPLVRAGGYLLYSTCTYSTEENERVVIRVLREHPELSLVPVKKELAGVTKDGLAIDGITELKLTRRFYPHVSEGEGQYIALFKKDESTSDLSTVLYKDASKSVTKEEKRIVDEFFKSNFERTPCGRLIKHGELVVLVAHECPIPSHSVFMPGVAVGEIRKGVLFPHQQLISAYGNDMKRKENLKSGDVRVEKYLRGEEIAAVDVTDNGWCAVCYEGMTLGGGKVSSGVIKNHYPKGLRTK